MNNFQDADEFKNHLLRIYGKSVVEGFLLPKLLQLKKDQDLISFADNYKRNKTEGCDLCRTTYNFIKPNDKIDFDNRNMDFPSWLGKLDFTIPNRKDIMIMGESVTGKLKNQRKLGIAFGLGMDVNEKEDIDEVSDRSKKFWTKFRTIFKDRTDFWLNKLYITDIGKCNAYKNPMIYNACGLSHTIHELRYIHPKLLIFLGHDPRNGLIPIIQNQQDIKIRPLEFLKSSNISFYHHKNLCSGELEFSNSSLNTITYITIPHTAARKPPYNQDSFWINLQNELHNFFPKFF